MNTTYTSFDTAFVVSFNGQDVGRVWYQEDTEWKVYMNSTDLEYDFVDGFDKAVDMVLSEENITQTMIDTEVSYRIIGRHADNGNLYHVSSDFKSLLAAKAYKENYCGKCTNDKNDTFAIIKLVPELLEV